MWQDAHWILNCWTPLFEDLEVLVSLSSEYYPPEELEKDLFQAKVVGKKSKWSIKESLIKDFRVFNAKSKRKNWKCL